MHVREQEVTIAGMKSSGIKNTVMKSNKRNETNGNWKSILFPLLLTLCLVFPGIFLPFPAGSVLPDSFLSVSTAVCAAEVKDEGADLETASGQPAGNDGIPAASGADASTSRDSAADDFQADAAVRSAQPDIAEGDDALVPANDAYTETDSPGTEAGSGINEAPYNEDSHNDDSLENSYDNSYREETAGTQNDPETGSPDQAGLSDRERMLPDGETPDDDLRVGDGDPALPPWYPRDPLSFPFYHDENAPRVIDIADIFSGEEEQQMEARLAELRASLGKDIVILADVSTYGLSRSVYAADFYDFNGYGIGPDREGVCLMICMEPGNRGWWCCCTGPVTRGLYDETTANQIDDMLYDYMRAGNYGAGVADWIENFRRLYTTGSPYSEEWALMDVASFERFHDPDAPRVVDDAKLLSDSEIEKLTQKAAALSDKYGVDIIVHTARSQGLLDRDTYSRKYYLSHGYGFSDDYDGIQLTIFKRPGYTGGANVYASGKGLKKLSAVNKKRLEDRCDGLICVEDYYEGASQWLDQAGHMLRTGRAPRSSASWRFTTILEMLAGLLFGFVSLGKAKAGMATPAMKENANSYIVKNGVRIRNVENRLLDSRVNQIYSPVKRESSDSGDHSSGGGSSTFHSSYSGSSGSSHSGSGRDF